VAQNLKFTSWQRSSLTALADPGADGRLTGKVKLTLTDVGGGDVAEDARFALLSAADVAGLKPGAIRGVQPPRSSHDAEVTKVVHVDFAEADFPWRYTPEKTPALGAGALRPWLVVLVGKADALKVTGNVVAEVADSVLIEHNLDQSWLWAHIQDDGAATTSRVLSPCQLQPWSQYTAAIVPAFNADGKPMWAVSGNPGSQAVQKAFGKGGVLPVFDSWQFWTGEKGDFETLAAALRVRKTGYVGTVALRYRRTVTNVDVTLQLRGAITSLATEPDQATDLDKARADLDVLNNPVTEPALPDGTPGRQFITMPAYGRPWVPDPDQAKWGKTLNDDPRYRSIAGIGLVLGVEAQEPLMEAAVTQAGALEDAGNKLRHLAIGLEAAGRLWGRRLADDPRHRARVFGPALGRILADDGGTVLARVTGDDRTLDPAIFSSAAQRLLRDGTARSRFAAGSRRIDRSAFLDAANEPPEAPDRRSAGVPHADRVAEETGRRTIEEVLGMPGDGIPPEMMEVVERFTGARIDAEFVSAFSEALAATGRRCGRRPAEELRSSGAEVAERHMLVRAVRRCLAGAADNVEGGRDLGTTFIDATPPRDDVPLRPVNIDVLVKRIGDLIDPTREPAPAVDRLRATIRPPELVARTPPELPLGLDFPTWQLVNQYHRDWLLPAVGTIANDSILSLQTNPHFVDAFMVGINTQFMAEMRWRNLAIDRRFTPLRMFWGYVNHATGRREADIQPLAVWAANPAADVGDLSHQAIKPGDTTGKKDLVIVFRTDLFRRYPATLVYLVRPKPGATEAQIDDLLKKTPTFEHPPTAGGRANREFLGPIFTGAITPDVVFFAFDADPGDLAKYWLVLDEPPAELRFRHESQVPPPGWQPPPVWPPADKSDSAKFAKTTLDRPTRVAISGAYLEQQAMQ
jgi:hypothetical protein